MAKRAELSLRTRSGEADLAYSQAYWRFIENCKDVERLLELHAEKAGDTPGRKRGVEVLSKSGVVLICAYWEAYVEDICAEALVRLLASIKEPSRLPEDLRMAAARMVRDDKDERAPWSLAGDGWRIACSALLSDRLQRLNNPNSERARVIVKLALGIPDITDAWARARLPKTKACRKLDDSIELRGSIAHRGKASESVKKWQCESFLVLVKEFAWRTDKRILKHLKEAYGIGFALKKLPPSAATLLPPPATPPAP